MSSPTIDSEDSGATEKPQSGNKPATKQVANLSAREYGVVAQLGSYSKRNLYAFLRKHVPSALAMSMASVLDIWHRDCLRSVDKVSDLLTTDRNANTDVADAQQIAQEANKARLDELKELLHFRKGEVLGLSTIQDKIIHRIAQLTADKEQNNGYKA